jgi:hypothetical protein
MTELNEGLLLVVTMLTAFASASLVMDVTAVAKLVIAPASENGWPILAANLDRTLWTPGEARGHLSVEWHRST